MDGEEKGKGGGEGERRMVITRERMLLQSDTYLDMPFDRIRG